MSHAHTYLMNRRENALRCQAPPQATLVLGADFYYFHIPLRISGTSAPGGHKQKQLDTTDAIKGQG